MEFGNEDIVNTFLDTEAPPALSPQNNHKKEDPKEGVTKDSAADKTAAASPNTTSTTASSGGGKNKKDGAIKGPSRRRHRPKGKPRRPLCGYNIFFQRHSKEIQPTTAFKDLGRIMGERWKALSEEERAVYEKEAEKDVIRFRREMDAYEKRRQERLRTPKSPLGGQTGSFYANPGVVPSANLKPPPGWSASNAGSLFGHVHPPGPLPSPSSNSMFSVNQGPQQLPSTVLHVPGQFVGPPPPTMALPQGTEITLPDTTGVARKFRVVYACYRMTENEANDYMARFAAITTTWHPGAVPHAPHPPPSPQSFARAVPPPSPHTFQAIVPPPPSPQTSRPTYSHPPPPQPHSPRSPRPTFTPGDPRGRQWPN